MKFDVHLRGAPNEVVQLVQNIKDVSLSCFMFKYTNTYQFHSLKWEKRISLQI